MTFKILAIAFILAGLTAVTHGPAGEKVFVTTTLGDADFTLLLADTDEKRQQGLGGVESLGNQEGMLFVFPEPKRQGIWMKEMRIPLDIIWLGTSGEVVHIEKNVSPDTYPQIFLPEAPSSYVIELNAGVVEEIGLAVGDVIELAI